MLFTLVVLATTVGTPLNSSDWTTEKTEMTMAYSLLGVEVISTRGVRGAHQTTQRARTEKHKALRDIKVHRKTFHSH